MKKEIKETAKKQGFQVVKYALYSCSLPFSHEAICTLCIVFFLLHRPLPISSHMRSGDNLHYCSDTPILPLLSSLCFYVTIR